jgi:hypothetical protein
VAVEQLGYVNLSAAADYLGNGAIEVPIFQREISDIVRRRGVLGQRLEQFGAYRPATGNPSRWFQQVALPNNQAYTDPRNITPVASNNTLRQEFSLQIKALTGQINFGLFDREVTQQQGLYTQLQAKDLEDMVTGLYQLEDLHLWTGSAPSITDTTSPDICGLQTQITNTATNTSGSIVDFIRTQIAKMVANQSWVVRPTAIYLHPLLLDLIEQEVKNQPTTLHNVMLGTMEAVPGVEVSAMNTAAGKLPLIPAWELPATPNQSDNTKTDYPCFIISENMLEYHYVGDKNVRVFQLGLQSDLQQKFVAVKFGAIVAKYPNVAHAALTITR